MKKSLENLNMTGRLIALFVLSVIMTNVTAQAGASIAGTIKEAGSSEAVPFANIALFDSTGAKLVGGAMSDLNGEFVIKGANAGTHHVRISAIGFETLFLEIEVERDTQVKLGEIILFTTDITIEGVVIVGERVKAMSGADKTIFNVSRKMQEASTSGADVLKLIPGVQVDLQQNISLEGSSNILILVNGRERDRNYLSQLTAAQIDQIEIISTPSSAHNGAVNGVINVILDRKNDSGLDGHIHVEIPTSDSEIYLFPSYSLNYGFKKLNIFTSYSGELAYLDIQERLSRKIFSESGSHEIISTQNVRQKNWSHRCHFGFDYNLNERNQLNFYGFFNPYSWEHDGDVELTTSGNETPDWFAQKEDNDMNNSAFYSIFYKHVFNERAGHEITADASFYSLNAENTTTFSNPESGYYQVNSTKPRQENMSFKLDHKVPIISSMTLNSGIQVKKQDFKDKLSQDFSWIEETQAAYSELHFDSKKIDLLAGIRFEHSEIGLHDQDIKKHRELLPSLNVNFKLANSQSIRFSYRKSYSRPRLHQLNPAVYINDPYSIQAGNKNLQPELKHNISIEHSRRFENSFIATRAFYSQTVDAINTFTHINRDGIFETNTFNLGTLHRYGLQFTGSFSIGNSFSLQPYLRLLEVQTAPNKTGRESGLKNTRNPGLESGFSAMANLKHGITASVLFQYNTPNHELQRAYYSGALYFVSLEKMFGRSFKAGITSGVPFSRTFVYNGYEIENDDFSMQSEGVVRMSAVPVWFKLTYQFSTGKTRARIVRQTETIEKQPRKGF